MDSADYENCRQRRKRNRRIDCRYQQLRTISGKRKASSKETHQQLARTAGGNAARIAAGAGFARAVEPAEAGTLCSGNRRAQTRSLLVGRRAGEEQRLVAGGQWSGLIVFSYEFARPYRHLGEFAGQ